MLKSLQKFLTIIIILVGFSYLLFQLFLYSRERALLPPDASIAGIDVSGLSREEAMTRLNERYLAPLILFHREERIEIPPQDVGFILDNEAMVNAALEQWHQRDYWQGYLEFLIGRSLEPVKVTLQATHDRNALIERLRMIASILDKPPKDPLLLGESAVFEAGEAGYVTDLQASLPLVETALYRADDRQATLIVSDEDAPSLDIHYLEDNIRKQLSVFDGIGSVFILDLQTGEELGINENVAMSGLSIVKIPILLETYRKLNTLPNVDQSKLISETAILSGDFSANLLLDVVAGQDNAYLGVDILTESMHKLGLVNTFIVTPYEEPARGGKSTLVTPANSRPDITTNPDPAMQTTAEDIGTLLEMIYRCANNGGALLAVYPDQLTPDECQAILEIMVLNTEGNLIRYGVPETVPVSHKHGWANNTHGDAGIVFSPGGDYVIVTYLSKPYTDWLVVDISFPILREISRAAYNYFNFENPNLEDPVARSEREAALREAEAQAQAEAEAEAQTESPTEDSPTNGAGNNQ